MVWQVFRHEPYNIKVDVYSFAMILYQLLEHCAPFQGMDPVEAAQKAALQNVRPKFKNLDSKTRPMPVSRLTRSFILFLICVSKTCPKKKTPRLLKPVCL